MNPAAETSGVTRTLRILRERWWIVALATIMCVAAALAHALTTPNSYQATSKLLFRDANLGNVTNGATINPQSSDPARDAATNQLLIKTNAVALRVKGALRLSESMDDLLTAVATQSEENADIVDITATDASPVRAAAIANAFATQFVTNRRQADQKKVTDALLPLQRQLRNLPPASSARDSLQTNVNGLIQLRASQTGNAEVADAAEAPTTPSSPRPKRDGILALFFGVALGVGLAFARDFFDRRVKTAEDFEAGYGVRALAAVPQASFATVASTPEALEPYRMVRTSLEFSAAGDVRVLLVTSAIQGEGKTSVAVNLARAVALAGRQVILVEADLRRPSFGEHFGSEMRTTGVTTAIVAGRPVRDLLRQVVPGLPNLSVLSSGPLPPSSAELLRSGAMSRVLDELRAEADLVIIDAPPLLPVADAQVLLDQPLVDAVLLVARANHTTRQDVRRTRSVLEQHNRQASGIVVTGVKDAAATYAYYEEAPVAGRARAERNAGRDETGTPDREREEVR